MSAGDDIIVVENRLTAATSRFCFIADIVAQRCVSEGGATRGARCGEMMCADDRIELKSTALFRAAFSFDELTIVLFQNCFQSYIVVFAYPILPLQFAYRIPFLNIDFRPWRLLVLVLALPCAAAAILLQFFHESPKFLASRGRNEDALKVLQDIYATNSGDGADNFPVVKLLPETEGQSFFANPESSLARALWEQIAALFRPPLLNRTLQLFYLVSIIYMTGSGFIMWLPYVMNRLFLTLDAASAGVSLCDLVTAEDGALVSNSTAPIECNDEIQQTTLLSAMTYGALATGANLLLSLAGGSHKRIAMLCVLATSAVAAVLINLVASPIAGGVFFFFFMMCALSMGLLSVYFVELYPTSLSLRSKRLHLEPSAPAPCGVGVLVASFTRSETIGSVHYKA
ncbi:Synaptic vesicle glycoprotein 2B [Eumeta japonica]|uniref:Synaptic vesicle glycoprotein 2B n=1 Tax=Eumeta variegata TaxID=151549 RepID=A0A4C1U615_EUMVA|nr:Synaptic vesicle glycoprotein 2B [Eumeta japonica]